jgi:hypothetical protein
MKNILRFAFIFFAFKVIAQPNFTASDLNFVVGETFSSRSADTTGIFQGGAGPNQVWNFTLVTNGNDDFAEILDVNNVSFSGAFPSANIVIKDSNAFGDVAYTFFNQSNDSSVFIGEVSLSPPNIIDTLIYNNPLLYNQYPFTYLSTYNDIAQISSGANASINRSSGTYDAYGDITVNGVLFPNTLRRHQFDTTIFGGVFSTTIYYERFQWLSIGEKSPLLSISYFRFGNIGPYEKDVVVNGNIFASIKQIKGEPSWAIYPNPANSELKISNAFQSNVFYEIKDLSGKTIASDQLNTISKSIDIKALSEGMYILELKNKDKILTKKFVKRS